MLNRSFFNRLHLWLAMALLLAFGAAMAAEPTLKQVYDAAQSGRLDEAQTMMQQVLVAHPNSAKAHFVNAELLVRRGHPEEARTALRTAEQLAPGLPFAKPEAVEGLRSRLSKPASARSQLPTGQAGGMLGADSVAGAAGGIPWTLLLVGGGAVLALVMFMRRRKAVAAAGPMGAGGPLAAAPFGGQQPAAGTWQGQQQFGNNAGPYGAQPGIGGYGQPAGGGMGGRVMGGLATGLAVGAGVMAAQAIGKTLGGGHDQASAAPPAGGNEFAGGGGSYDMGGDNFGVADGGSWDDNASIGGIDGGGDSGGDW